MSDICSLIPMFNVQRCNFADISMKFGALPRFGPRTNVIEDDSYGPVFNGGPWPTIVFSLVSFEFSCYHLFQYS